MADVDEQSSQSDHRKGNASEVGPDIQRTTTDTAGPSTSGPATRREYEQRYGVSIDTPGQADRLQRLEQSNTLSQVQRWADEGIPIEAMGTPSEMVAYRSDEEATSQGVNLSRVPEGRSIGSGIEQEDRASVPTRGLGNTTIQRVTDDGGGKRQRGGAKIQWTLPPRPERHPQPAPSSSAGSHPQPAPVPNNNGDESVWDCDRHEVLISNGSLSHIYSNHRSGAPQSTKFVSMYPSGINMGSIRVLIRKTVTNNRRMDWNGQTADFYYDAELNELGVGTHRVLTTGGTPQRIVTSFPTSGSQISHWLPDARVRIFGASYIQAKNINEFAKQDPEKVRNVVHRRGEGEVNSILGELRGRLNNNGSSGPSGGSGGPSASGGGTRRAPIMLGKRQREDG